MSLWRAPDRSRWSASDSSRYVTRLFNNSRSSSWKRYVQNSPVTPTWYRLHALTFDKPTWLHCTRFQKKNFKIKITGTVTYLLSLMAHGHYRSMIRPLWALALTDKPVSSCFTTSVYQYINCTYEQRVYIWTEKRAFESAVYIREVHFIHSRTTVTSNISTSAALCHLLRATVRSTAEGSPFHTLMNIFRCRGLR